MKKFVLVERHGGGCDYTIGCGIRVTELEAESLEEAYQQTVEDGDIFGQTQQAIIYEVVAAMEIDITRLEQEAASELAAQQEEAEQETEEQEFERLKKKLGR